LENYGKNGKEPAESAATIDQLAAAAESAKGAYDNFRHVLRKAVAMQQQSSPVFEASLVAAASPPLRASSPKARIVLGIAIVGGVLAGIAIAMLRQLLGRGIRTSGQESRLSAPDDRIDRPLPDTVRPEYQSQASAKASPVRLTGSG
jgi:hypothetical protein